MLTCTVTSPSIDQDGAPGPPAYEETDTSIPLMRPAKRKEPYDESSTIGQTAQSTKRNKPYDESFTIGRTAQLTDSTVMEEIIRVIDAKLAAHKLMVQDMLAAHKDEVAKMIESVEADLPYKIKEEVEKEADGVKEYVMERIASMPVQAYFTFPDHPYL